VLFSCGSGVVGATVVGSGHWNQYQLLRVALQTPGWVVDPDKKKVSYPLRKMLSFLFTFGGTNITSFCALTPAAKSGGQAMRTVVCKKFYFGDDKNRKISQSMLRIITRQEDLPQSHWPYLQSTCAHAPAGKPLMVAF
jgi:hypothetical protein